MDAKTKITVFRVLKVISYCIGFPLMVLLLWKDKLTLFNSVVYADTANNALFIAIAVWLFVTLVQIGLTFLMKGGEKRKQRLLITVVVALIVTLLPALIIDAVWSSKLKKLSEEYSTYGVSAVDYEKAAAYYSPKTAGEASYALGLSSNISEFCKIYNIEYESMLLGGNFDNEHEGYDSSTDIVYDEENDVYLKPNGMYADGYVFGLKSAMANLITYYEVSNKYNALAKADDALFADVNEAYAQALARASASQAWIDYSSTEEFIANAEEALNYYVDESRLNTILGVFGPILWSAPFLNGRLIETLLPIIGNLELSVTEAQRAIVIAHFGIYSEANTDGIAEDAEKVALNKILAANNITLNEEFFNTLTVDGLFDVLGVFGLDIAKDDLMGLLQGYSFFQSSYNKPIWDFFLDEDKDLAEYGRAYYYATLHGSLCDSVLLPTTDGGKIGKASDLDGDGYPASSGYSLYELYSMQLELEYVPQLYPMLSARYYLYVFAGIIAMAFILSGYFGDKQRKFEEEV